MKTRISLTAIATVLLLAGATPGQAEQDQICIYFEESGTNCAEFAPGLVASAYLVLQNISEPSGILAWACHIDVTPPGTFVVNWICIGPCPSGVWTPPDFLVGFFEPVPWAPQIPVLEIQVLVLPPDPIYFWIQPYTLTPPPFDYPVYAPADDPAATVNLDNCTGYDPGGEPNPAGCINCDCNEVIAADGSTWGALKALYN